MKKVIISVISTLLVLAFMVQMGWLQVIGINRFSFEKSDNTQNKLDFECASENNITIALEHREIIFIITKIMNGKRYLLQE